MKLILVFLTAGVLFSSSLHSAITIYTDRTAWRNAAGGSQLFYVDFNSYTTDVAATGPLDVGPFTLSPDTAAPWDMPLIETTQGWYGNALVGGTSGVTMRNFGYGYSYQSLVVNFDSPISTFGFDIADSFGPIGGMTRWARITTSSGDSYDFIAQDGGTRFIGFITGASFTSLFFSGVDNVRPVIDNFEANAVPEPSAGALLVLGAGVLALIRRRKV